MREPLSPIGRSMGNAVHAHDSSGHARPETFRDRAQGHGLDPVRERKPGRSGIEYDEALEPQILDGDPERLGEQPLDSLHWEEQSVRLVAKRDESKVLVEREGDVVLRVDDHSD